MSVKRIWMAVLAIVLILWGLILLDWVSFDNSNDVLGIGAIIAGILLVLDR
jgi:uncharacterized membrane protein HdeD (DUF308 family)